MRYTPLHNYGSPALARMIRDAARQEFGFRHPKTAAAQGHLDALLGRSVPQSGVGRVAYARQKGQAGYRNKGARKHLGLLRLNREAAVDKPVDHDWVPDATWFVCSKCGIPAPAPHASAPEPGPCTP